MKILFENSQGQRREIGNGTRRECFNVMNKFLADHKFKSYYTIETKLPNGDSRLDVGSHTEFFYLVEK